MNQQGKRLLSILNQVDDSFVQKAGEPAGHPRRRRRARWIGAVAAGLAIVITGTVVLWSGAGENAGGTTAYALEEAVYPSMHPYPKEEDFFTDFSQEENTAYDQAYEAWWEDRKALQSGKDYREMLSAFLTSATPQFLSGQEGENQIYSPLNLYMALSMLAETTGGDSRRQILDLLGADSVETLREQALALWRDNYRDDGVITSVLGNALWLADGMSYSQEVLQTLKESYYASSFSGKMGEEQYSQALRDWLNQQTHGLLKQQADTLKFNPETVLALTSTLYFKAAWDDSFSQEQTRLRPFYTASGEVETDFMHRVMQTSYYWGDHFAAVELTFQQGRQESMWLLLPDEGTTVEQLIQSGEAMEFLLAEKSGEYNEETETFENAWPGQKYLKVNLAMPKFDLSSNLDLTEGLKHLGVTDVFDMGKSDFTPLAASTDDPLYLSQAKHAARLMVDEEGCEAAAYTQFAIAAGAEMPPEEEVDLILDRPFLVSVTGGAGVPLFLGIVNQPNR